MSKRGNQRARRDGPSLERLVNALKKAKESGNGYDHDPDHENWKKHIPECALKAAKIGLSIEGLEKSLLIKCIQRVKIFVDKFENDLHKPEDKLIIVAFLLSYKIPSKKSDEALDNESINPPEESDEFLYKDRRNIYKGILKEFAEWVCQKKLDGEIIQSLSKSKDLHENVLRFFKSIVVAVQHQEENRLLEKREKAKKLEAVEAEKRERIKKFESEIEKVVGLFEERKPDVEIPSSFSLSTRDMELVLAWSNQQKIEGINIGKLRKLIGDDHKFARLCSARVAELAAIQYYKINNDYVEDISITQLKQNSHAWETHDLMVSGRAVDVKSARPSFSNPDHYSGYMIPSFKKERRTRSDVSILAMLTDYQSAAFLAQGRLPSKSIIIGEATIKDVEDLKLWARNLPLISAESVKVNDVSRYPGWFFEYQYSSGINNKEIKDSIINLANEFVGDPLLHENSNFPIWLCLLIDNEDLVRKVIECSFNVQQKEHLDMCLHLKKVNAEIGLSRRSLFLFIINYTLQQAKRFDDAWSPQVLKSWLGLDGSNEPLWLCDPLRIISNLVEAMNILWSQKSDALRNYKEFDLRSPYLLDGLCEDSRRETVMANCCGNILLPNKVLVSCGINPLVFGKDERCAECGKLVCNKCGFCSDPRYNICSRMEERIESRYSIDDLPYFFSDRSGLKEVF